MTTREEIILVCDLCDKTEKDVDVVTHQITIDGMAVEAEACTDCWWKAMKNLSPLAQLGRKIKKTAAKRQVKRKVVDWPGSKWQFSSHALIRLGERHLDPVQVLRVVESPETSYPGIGEEESEVRMGEGLKVVVIPSRLLVVTASNRTSADIPGEAAAG